VPIELLLLEVHHNVTMSNPIVQATEAVCAEYASILRAWEFEGAVLPDGHFSASLDEIEAAAKERAKREALLEAFERTCCVSLRNSLLLAPLVRAGVVFNDGAKSRLLAITQTNPLGFRRRTLLAKTIRDVFVRALEREGAILNEAGKAIGGGLGVPLLVHYVARAVLERTTSYFMVAGGTQHSMGRVMSALPKPAVFRLSPVTPEEADKAYTNCGFYHGSFWETVFPEWADSYGRKWPLSGAPGDHVVTINKQASLGIPYYAKGDDERALTACISVVAEMLKGVWRTDAARAYRTAMIANPGMVMFLGKTKTDVYSETKIKEAKLRFYLVMPGHLKLLIQTVTQPFASAKVSLNDIFAWYFRNPFNGDEELVALDRLFARMHSAQKLGLTGGGADLLVRALDAQLAQDGIGYLHCGDDTIFVLRTTRMIGARRHFYLCAFGTDQSNFDLTQREEVVRAIDDRLQRGIAGIDSNLAALWREIRRGRLVNIHNAGVVYMNGLGTSGIPLQSEVNDMIEDVYCQRLWSKIKAGSAVLRNGQPYYEISKEQIEAHVRNIGDSMGLESRLEFFNEEWDMDNESHPLRGIMAGNYLTFDFLGYSFFVPDTMGRQVNRQPVERAGIGYQFEPEYEYLENQEPLAPYRGTESRRVVTCVAILPRLFTNLLYPSAMHIEDQHQFRLYDGVRVVGTLLQAGAPLMYGPTADAFACTQAILKFYVGRTKARHLRGDSDQSEFAPLGNLLSVGNTAGLARLIDELPWYVKKVWTPSAPEPRRLRQVVPAEIVGAPISLNWADEMDAEEGEVLRQVEHQVLGGDLATELRLRNVAGVLDLKVLLLRATTRANWSAPPPNVAVRFPSSLQSRAEPSGDARTQRNKKTRDRKKRARERKRGGFDEESTARHFEELRLEQLEEAMYG